MTFWCLMKFTTCSTKIYNIWKCFLGKIAYFSSGYVHRTLLSVFLFPHNCTMLWKTVTLLENVTEGTWLILKALMSKGSFALNTWSFSSQFPPSPFQLSPTLWPLQTLAITTRHWRKFKKGPRRYHCYRSPLNITI